MWDIIYVHSTHPYNSIHWVEPRFLLGGKIKLSHWFTIQKKKKLKVLHGTCHTTTHTSLRFLKGESGWTGALPKEANAKRGKFKA